MILFNSKIILSVYSLYIDDLHILLNMIYYIIIKTYIGGYNAQSKSFNTFIYKYSSSNKL